MSSRSTSLIAITMIATQFASAFSPLRAEVFHQSWTKMVSQGQVGIAWQGDDVGDNCRALDLPRTKIISAPLHGKAFLTRSKVLPHFPETNKHHHCNDTPVDGLYVYYRPEPDFIGDDQLAIKSTGIDGRTFIMDVTMRVVAKAGY